MLIEFSDHFHDIHFLLLIPTWEQETPIVFDILLLALPVFMIGVFIISNFRFLAVNVLRFKGNESGSMFGPIFFDVLNLVLVLILCNILGWLAAHLNYKYIQEKAIIGYFQCKQQKTRFKDQIKGKNLPSANQAYKIQLFVNRQIEIKMRIQFQIIITISHIRETKMEQQTYPDNSNVILQNKGVIKKELRFNNSVLEVLSSQVDVIIVGSKNRIKMEESAGRVYVRGNENQIQFRKSWIACRVEGNQNMFHIVQTEFQLISHQGEANVIPGILGEHHLPIRRRIMHERIIGMRIALKQKSESVKKLLPQLLKSTYNSYPRQCSICYDDIKEGDEVTSLFCFHFFHSQCIEACLETAVKCPVCSLDLLKVISDELKVGNLVHQNGQLVMRESMEIEPDEVKQ